MQLYLVESVLRGVSDRNSFESKVDRIQSELKENNATLIEIQVSKDFGRAFFIVESEGKDSVNESLRAQEVPVTLIKQVRLVGQDLEDVKKQADQVNYLVEWNLPEDLTMEAYLTRKKTNSVHYDEVPEVSFARTYVCEDMTKCLCFYDAPDELAVQKARKAVKAPIDSITEISSK